MTEEEFWDVVKELIYTADLPYHQFVELVNLFESVKANYEETK